MAWIGVAAGSQRRIIHPVWFGRPFWPWNARRCWISAARHPPHLVGLFRVAVLARIGVAAGSQRRIIHPVWFGRPFWPWNARRCWISAARRPPYLVGLCRVAVLAWIGVAAGSQRRIIHLLWFGRPFWPWNVRRCWISAARRPPYLVGLCRVAVLAWIGVAAGFQQRVIRLT